MFMWKWCTCAMCGSRKIADYVSEWFKACGIVIGRIIVLHDVPGVSFSVSKVALFFHSLGASQSISSTCHSIPGSPLIVDGSLLVP